MKISRDNYLKRIKANLSKDKITFLIGARRVGKTTLIKEFQKKIPNKSCFYFSFDDIVSLPLFTSTKHFLDYLRLKKDRDFDKIEYLFLDEVQNIPNIEVIFKDLVDNYKKFKILASGSGSFEIFHNIKESLMGRKEVIYIYPITFNEFLNYKNENIQTWKKHWYSELFIEKKNLIEEFLRFGGYPSVICASTEEAKFHELKNIIDTWLDTDIRLILQKEDFLSFKPVLELLANNTGSLVKISNITQKLGINNHKIKKFLHIMQKSFLLDFIDPYFQKRADEIKSHQKAYFIDNGVLNFLNQNFALKDQNKGKIVENFVFSELLKNKKESHIIKFWRTKNGTEIDFIIFDILKNSFDLIEVKSKSTDIIPKIFCNFIEFYQGNINKMSLLNQDLLKIKKIHNKEVIIKPYYFTET